MSGSIIGYCIVLALGVLFLLVGYVIARSFLYLSRVGTRTRGVVAEYKTDGDGSWPVVEFEDRSGAMHRVSLMYGDGKNVGEGIDIIYDPKDPTDAMGCSWFQSWFAALLAIFLGSLAVARLDPPFGFTEGRYVGLSIMISAVTWAIAWLSSRRPAAISPGELSEKTPGDDARSDSN